LQLATAHQIWEGLQAGDVQALKALYQFYHQDLFQYGKRMTKDEQLIEDALQETFLSIWKYRRTASLPAAVKPYVLKVFRNELLRLFRERSAILYTDESLDFSFEIAFDQKIIEGEDAGKLSADINKALQQLTSRQRELIYYRFYENLSFEEIGGLMNMQTRATYKLAARALAALRELMEQNHFRLLLMLLGRL
jgi:RNA polymerase sigma factor (sigma-70 family)